MNNPIGTKEFTDFLHETNKSTYANKETSKVVSSRLKSKDYHFKKGEFTTITYFGGRDFIGEEIVYKKEKPVWGRKLFWLCVVDKVSEKDAYDFLRQSFMQNYNDVIPMREPNNFFADDKMYHFIADGDLANFSGKEEISFGEKFAYRCLTYGDFIR